MEKKNNIALCLVIGCMITLLGALLGIYVGKGLVDCTCDKDCNTNKPSEVVENVKKSAMIDVCYSALAILDDGNTYVNVNNASPFGNELEEILKETQKRYKSYEFKNVNYLDSLNSGFTGIKLNVADVSMIYNYTTESSALTDKCGLLLLNQDKTVSIISMKSLINGKTEVTKIPELKDIKEIYTDTVGTTDKTYAVDNNGTKYNVYDYLKTDY